MKPEDSRPYEVIIIGGGPAGLTGGLYASRARLRTLLIESAIFGGQMTTTEMIENYPGFPQGITGDELSRLMEEIFGAVGDELGAAEKEFELINEHTFQVDGGMRIEEANTEIGLGLPDGDYETVAGFILHLMGRIPKQGQQLKYHDLKIVITKMKGLKIEEVLITREKAQKDEPSKNPL